jgi:hypothetical protein
VYYLSKYAIFSRKVGIAVKDVTMIIFCSIFNSCPFFAGSNIPVVHGSNHDAASEKR